MQQGLISIEEMLIYCLRGILHRATRQFGDSPAQAINQRFLK
jgi:hypothetical protein